ncbi:hypothetical protein U1Q18_028596 [Sarracenia purpurea var. burkii]
MGSKSVHQSFECHNIFDFGPTFELKTEFRSLDVCQRLLRFRATKYLTPNHSSPSSNLLVKLEELCGSSVSLRCQLPTEDLDALVSITPDEDLANLIEEYDRVASPTSALKIRAFLFPPRTTKKISSPSCPVLSMWRCHQNHYNPLVHLLGFRICSPVRCILCVMRNLQLVKFLPVHTMFILETLAISISFTMETFGNNVA